MTKAKMAGWAFAAVVVVLLALAAVRRASAPAVVGEAPASFAIPPGAAPPSAEAYQGFIYGRITAVEGTTYEGRLRWGDDEEAFWSDYFNGGKRENPWLAQIPPDKRPKESDPIEVFGVKLAQRERPLEVRRQLKARFGEIARIEAGGRHVLVTLKSGTVFDLDRFEASDFDDDVRVWDATRGVLDFDSLRIHAIDLLPTPPLGALPSRLHGTVHTKQGDFTGSILWQRGQCLGTDELHGRTADGKRSLRFDTIRAIELRPPVSAQVTLVDGSEIALTLGERGGGVYVDDPRYGRVLIGWEAFERIDFSPGGSGPAYGDFPAGRPLAGTVTTRAGNRLTGRLVYDLDESETTETLDASAQGIDYAIPFGLVASIVPAGAEDHAAQPAKVTLHGGEELQLEREGDLGEQNAGMLIFVEGAQHPEFVPWSDVARVDFDRPPAMYPPLAL